MSKDLLDIARRIFAADTFATETTGIELEHIETDGTSGRARCRLALRPQLRNAMGSVMGGAIFTLADFAFAAAANASVLCEGSTLYWVSLNSTIHYLAAARGDTLQAEARCIKQGRTSCLYEIDIHDNTGRHVAHVETTGLKI